MAISMSGATVNTDERESLLQSSVDGSGTYGGETANATFWTGKPTGKPLAGVTASFAANVSRAIDSYSDDVMEKLNQLQTANSEVAFKGTALKSALETFIESVKEVSISYLNKLKAAETQIINSVQTAYETQDTDLGSNLGSDGSNLESNSIK